MSQYRLGISSVVQGGVSNDPVWLGTQSLPPFLCSSASAWYDENPPLAAGGATRLHHCTGRAPPVGAQVIECGTVHSRKSLLHAGFVPQAVGC